ncbi:hypothetical protein BSL78_15546 [Apostichopus japonicus]|uniref:Uncharacterized protein n=1 Tax=Stichopus japonicus TaxID=307972 RepID=A0A2G8KHX0_STIJA|nr:hypothetical protein BSL78_15546 [Apostichopus japonicus]
MAACNLSWALKRVSCHYRVLPPARCSFFGFSVYESIRVSRTSGGPSPGNFRGRTSFAISRTQSQFFVPLDQNSVIGAF